EDLGRPRQGGSGYPGRGGHGFFQAGADRRSRTLRRRVCEPDGPQPLSDEERSAKLRNSSERREPRRAEIPAAVPAARRRKDAAADRINNPGIGLVYPYLPLPPEREDSFWQSKAQSYVGRLRTDKQEEGRIAELKPLWDQFYAEQLARAEADLKTATEAASKTT